VHPAAEAPAALPTTPAIVRERAGVEVMRAIVLEKFGGLDSLIYTEIPKPRPRVGEVVIAVKAFGINHAEMHMRRGSVSSTHVQLVNLRLAPPLRH
jgi:NADPH2:quinone reductase